LPKYAASLYLHKREQPLRMSVIRGDQSLDLTIMPQPAHAGVESLADLIRPNDTLIAPLGIFVVTLTKDVLALLPDVQSQSGVVIAGALQNEPQVLADLSPGDVIRSLNQLPIHQPSDLRSAIAALKPSDAAVLEVERNGVLRWVAFDME
jgi:S1-C subfamily serine protease